VNWVDWSILAVLGFSTLLSLKRGFVREALSLLAWVAAFLVSTGFSARLAARLVDLIGNDSLRYAAAYVLLFAATLMLGSFVNALMARLIRLTGLSGADRLMGTAFGFARGLVVLLVLLFVLRAVVPTEDRDFLRESRLMPHLEVVEAWARRNFADAVSDAVVAVGGEW